MIRRPLLMIAAGTALLAPATVVSAQATQPASQQATSARTLPARAAAQRPLSRPLQPPQSRQPQEEEPQQTLAEAKLKESLASAAEVAPLPRVRAKSVGEVISLTIRDKDLHLSTWLGPTDGAAVDVPGLPGITRVVVVPADDSKGAPLKHFELRNFDYGTPNAVSVNTAVWQAVPGRLDITQDYNLLSDEVHSVHLIQTLGEMIEGEPRVMLHVQLTAPPGVRLQLAADNIVELRHNYPAEVSKYLDPIFRTLSQDGLLAKVDPKLAWQVFGDEYKPAPELVSQVQALLKKLDAESFQDREAASKALAALDQPAALALRRMDRAGWSEEQVGRVDAFLAKFKPTNDVDAKRLRRDRDFLLDCLFSDDAQIRQLAFAQLQSVVGRPIEFNLAAPPQQRLESIQRLRASVGATPTTNAKTPLE